MLEERTGKEGYNLLINNAPSLITKNFTYTFSSF